MASRDQQASGKALDATRRAHAGPESPSPQPASAPAPNHHLPILTRLLNGQTQDLAPIRTNPIACRDAALDVHQREAVARALATSDFCLIRGLPGTGKSRVVAELVVQATAREERVLLGALTSAAIDRVLEMVHAHEEVSAIRCLAPEEGIENLPPFSRALTFAERMN
ncbi:MAG TPA: AAA domain-containing protein, partial [Gemmataceae bacterium]|nr:AAA domain-containing protein [Gemmataceae bacterium]